MTFCGAFLYHGMEGLDATLVSRLVHTLLAAPGMDGEVLLHGPWVDVGGLHYSSWMEPQMFCSDPVLLHVAPGMEVGVLCRDCLPYSPAGRTVHL